MCPRMCDPQMANLEVTLPTSIFDEERQEMLTFELTARMPGMVLSSRAHSQADSKESRHIHRSVQEHFRPTIPAQKERGASQERVEEQSFCWTVFERNGMS